MKVLIVEPMKPCYVREISGLKAMQEVVGEKLKPHTLSRKRWLSYVTPTERDSACPSTAL